MEPRLQDPYDAHVYHVERDSYFVDPLGPHFTVSEFQCNDGTPILLLHTALVELVKRCRHEFKAPVIINSAYRTHAHNAAVGGAEDSRHVYGMAADIDVQGVPPATVADWADAVGVGGVGRYDTFTHLDVWGENRRWNLRSDV